MDINITGHKINILTHALSLNELNIIKQIELKEELTMKRTLIIALAVLLSVSIAYMSTNSERNAYKANQGYMTKI